MCVSFDSVISACSLARVTLTMELPPPKRRRPMIEVMVPYCPESSVRSVITLWTRNVQPSTRLTIAPLLATRTMSPCLSLAAPAVSTIVLSSSCPRVAGVSPAIVILVNSVPPPSRRWPLMVIKVPIWPLEGETDWISPSRRYVKESGLSMPVLGC